MDTETSTLTNEAPTTITEDPTETGTTSTQDGNPAKPDRFQRQAGLVPQDRLANVVVDVVGVGAIGRQVALQLASIGVRQIRLIDFDTVDETNITTQGYPHKHIGVNKVFSLYDTIGEIDSSILVAPLCERWKASHAMLDNRGMDLAIFCCVDTISVRAAIWKAAKIVTNFWCDARMLGEQMRILTVAGDDGLLHYPTTLFAQEEAQEGACTARSTIYTANIAAGLMVHQFARWLRAQPTDNDFSFNLLASELVVATDESP